MNADEWCDLARQRLDTIYEKNDVIGRLRSELELAAEQMDRDGNTLAARSIRVTLAETR